jgi:sugar/nucleoside kinase (ribokinase family)
VNVPARHVLFGPASIDRYVDDGIDLPGGGALNMAWHWSRAPIPFTLISRVGSHDSVLFERFIAQHGIAVLPSFVAPGRSASIDVTIRRDRQPWMDSFVEGVWRDVVLDDNDDAVVRSSTSLHAVMVDAVMTQVERLATTGALAHVVVSADFLDFRHVSMERFDRAMQHIDIAFIGWPGDVTDSTIDAIRDVVTRRHRIAVVTLGARGALLINGRASPTTTTMAPIDAVEVMGTTLGCGDAYIAAFLVAWWRTGDLLSAHTSGARAGAAATQWMRPLPDHAYT